MVGQPEDLGPLLDLHDDLHALGVQVRRRPLDHVLWLPHQLGLIRSYSAVRLLRTGNQLGKTWAGLAEIIWAATGEHPHRTPTKWAGEYWIICATWGQSVAIQKKLHHLIPRDALHPSTEFTEAGGFRGKNPSVMLRHRSGEWSIIRIKTTNQGTLALAGASIDGVLFDEPPASEAIYGEVSKRVQAQGGWILLTLTPIGAPVDWLEELVDECAVEDHHSRLTSEAMIPVGQATPIFVRTKDGILVPCDAAWVQHVRDTTRPAREIPVRVDGEWETENVDAYFRGAFRRSVHVTDEVPEVDLDLWGSFDHGHRPGKQIGLLGGAWGPRRRPEVYVLAEYVDWEGFGTPWDDARSYLAMLSEYGFEWRDLAWACGDRVHMKGSKQQKSNRDLMAALAVELGVDLDALLPRIRTVKRGEGRGSGSVKVGARWLFAALVEDRLRVHPRCVRLIRALERWRGPTAPVRRGSPDEDWQDPIDALRYGLDRYIFAPVRRRSAGPVALG